MGLDVDDGRHVDGVDPPHPEGAVFHLDEVGGVDRDGVGPLGAAGGEDTLARVSRGPAGVDPQAVPGGKVQPASTSCHCQITNGVQH